MRQMHAKLCNCSPRSAACVGVYFSCRAVSATTGAEAFANCRNCMPWHVERRKSDGERESGKNARGAGAGLGAGVGVAVVLEVSTCVWRFCICATKSTNRKRSIIVSYHIPWQAASNLQHSTFHLQLSIPEE